MKNFLSNFSLQATTHQRRKQPITNNGQKKQLNLYQSKANLNKTLVSLLEFFRSPI